jgi:hypothetical protein
MSEVNLSQLLGGKSFTVPCTLFHNRYRVNNQLQTGWKPVHTQLTMDFVALNHTLVLGGHIELVCD